MVVVGTKCEHIQSQWVRSEWMSFTSALLSGHKDGKVYTLLDGMNVTELPMALQSYISFQYGDILRLVEHISKTLGYEVQSSILSNDSEKIQDTSTLDEMSTHHDSVAKNNNTSLSKSKDNTNKIVAIIGFLAVITILIILGIDTKKSIEETAINLHSLLSLLSIILIVIARMIMYSFTQKCTERDYGYKNKTLSALENATPAENATALRKKFRSLSICLSVGIILNIITYLLSFLFEKREIDFVMSALVIIFALIDIRYTIESKEKADFENDINVDMPRILSVSYIKILSLIISVILIFAVITNVIYSFDSRSYDIINFSSWYDKAFALFFHSFSMCIRNESDVTTPISIIARLSAMFQTGIFYIVCVQGIGDILEQSKKKQ